MSPPVSLCLFDYLKERGIYEDTLVVVTGDHGEEFGEHGLYREHWSTHDGTQRVPLLIKPPVDADIERGHRSQLVTNVDMAPTLAEHAGFDAPAKWQGRSLWPVLESTGADWRDEIFFDHGLYTAQRVLRTDRWKLVETHHAGMWDGVVPETQLYDMEEDPWEQTNRAADRPAVGDELRGRLATLVEDYAGSDHDALLDVADQGPAGYRAFRDDFDGIHDSDDG